MTGVSVDTSVIFFILLCGIGGGTGLVAVLALGDEIGLGLPFRFSFLQELHLLPLVLLLVAGIVMLPRWLVLRGQPRSFQCRRPVAEALGNVRTTHDLAGCGRIGHIDALTYIGDEVGVAGGFIFYRKSLVLRLQGLDGALDDLLMQQVIPVDLWHFYVPPGHNKLSQMERHPS